MYSTEMDPPVSPMHNVYVDGLFMLHSDSVIIIHCLEITIV